MGNQLSLFEKPNLVEYFFLLTPPKEILDDVREIKAKIHSRIKLSPETLQSKAHISLLEFPQMNRTEEQIIEKSNRLFRDMQSFGVQMHGFGIFYHGRDKRTVYVKVKDSGPIQQMYTLLAGELKLKSEKFTPHLTIVRSIPAHELERIEDDLMNYEYANEFLCEKITLLKREINDDFQSAYQLVTKFPLKN